MSDPTHTRDLLARVGSLLLHWGRVEYEVQPPPPAGKLSAQVAIRKWARGHVEASRGDHKHRARIREVMLDFAKARRLRNLVAHGMVAAYGATATYPQPAIKCLSVDGEAVMIEAGELDAAIAALAALLPEIQALNRAAGLARRRND